MTAVIDSRALAQSYFDWVRAEVPRLRGPAGIAVLTLAASGEDSRTYRDMILKDAESLGLRARSFEERTGAALLERIDRLNADPVTHGIVVMYPLGEGLIDTEVMDRVSPAKDIEGLHSINLGYLIKFLRYLDEPRGVKCVVPATAKAVVKTLQAYSEIPIEGAFVVLINNSMRVGKPLGLMLENLGATVVKCYDRTRPEDMEACVRRADIVVTAVPDSRFRLHSGWVKPGAAVVDVSFGGNVDAASLQGRAAFVSSPDNRIGRMTRAMMLVNLIYCARRAEAGL